MNPLAKKVLNYINSSESIPISLKKLSEKFPKIEIDYLIEILYYLKFEDYIKFSDDKTIRSTVKGKTYNTVKRNNWLSSHIIEVLSLLISIIAIVLSIISFTRTS